MSAHSSGEWLLLFCTALIVVFRIFTFKRQIWEAPRNHSPSFFLGVEVSPGFYQGEGIGWLRRYRRVVLIELTMEALALVAVLLSGRWNLLPLWAGGSAVLLAGTYWGFTGYTRRTLGANPPVRPSVAVPLATRRLSDYISWPVEALLALTTAFGWALLLIHGDAQVYWKAPVVLTYIIVGLFPFKVGVVRHSFPVATERPEEHYRGMEAQRRDSLHVMDAARWFCMVLLGGYALVHGWRLVGASAWLRWSLIGIAMAVWLYLASTRSGGERRLTAMGRDLRPVGSWSTPFRPARLMPRGFVPRFAAWFGGLVLLLVFFRY